MKRALIAFFVFGTTLCLPVALMAQTPVFINELHYDNAGSDVGEGVEIAGPAGTDLTGWSIALYNGGNGQVYQSLTLAGIIPDQQNGYGVLAFAQSGLQNGPADGLALVDSSGTLQQFLSYEGAITATNGPAAGITSSDIGVAETTTTPVGFSLQLQDSGSVYEDFSWAEPAPDSMGHINRNQQFPPVSPPPLDEDQPLCEIIGISPGPPVVLSVMLQDQESGLSEVKILRSRNATVNVPEFAPGSTEAIIVTAEKINPRKGATVVLEVIDRAGNSIICDPVYTTLSSLVPDGFKLEQNYPNPFNPATTIRFAVPGSGSEALNVRLKVYDINGREVISLIAEPMASGEYAVEWNGSNAAGLPVASGVYFCHLTAGSYVQTRPMTLLR